MLFSHIQTRFDGPAVYDDACEPSAWPALAEAWARAEPKLRTDRRFVEFSLVRAFVNDIAHRLEARGFEVLALGHLMPGSSSTLELAVRPGRFGLAVDVLREQGVTCMADEHTALLVEPRLQLAVRLTRELSAAAMCQLTLRGVFERAAVARGMFDAPLLLPHPLDNHAYLVAQAARVRAGAGHALMLSLGAIVQQSAPQPLACARHLTDTELTAAARYVLPLLARPCQAHAQRVQNALPPSLTRAAFALLARGAVRYCPDSKLTAIPFHLLETPARRAVSKLCQKLIARARSAVSEASRRPRAN